MVFPARDSNESGIRRVIVIEEPDPEFNSCPPCPSDKDGGYIKDSIANHVVATKEIKARAREVTHDIRFRVGEVHIIVQIDWGVQSNSQKLTGDMSREDFRIVESFFSENSR